MVADFEPHPDAVGPAIMAWYALHGALKGDPAAVVAWAAGTIAQQLDAFGPGVANPLTPDRASVAVDDARLLLGMIAEIFGRAEPLADDEGRLAFKAELKRRRGRPAQNPLDPQSNVWMLHAASVESLIKAGDLQKVAVGKVAKQLGLKDAVVAGWCRDWRKALEPSRRRQRDQDKSGN